MQKILLMLMVAPAAFASPSPYYDDDLKVFEFTSPTGNIRCRGDRAPDPHVRDDEGFNGVECSVYSGGGREPSLPVLPKPDCDVGGFTTVFEVEKTGKATRYVGCSGDPYYNLDSPKLPYGKTVKGDGWQCTSSKEGMRCENADGHGFHLNRRRQKLF